MKKLVVMLLACMAAVSVFAQGRFIEARAPFEDSLAQQSSEQLKTFDTAYTKYLMVVLDHQGYQASNDKKAEALLEMARAYMGIDGLLRVEVGHDHFSGKRELENGEEVPQMALLVMQGEDLLSAEQQEEYETFLNLVETDEYVYQRLHEIHGEYSKRIDRSETIHPRGNLEQFQEGLKRLEELEKRRNK